MRKTEDEKRRLSFNATAVVFAALLFISFLFLFFSSGNFVNNFRGAGLSFFLGARSGIHKVSSAIASTALAIQELAVLREEYAELTKRVARYEQLERSAADILIENKRLREQLGFVQTVSYKTIPAEIIGKDPDNLYAAIVINKGVQDGVSVDMPVIAYQNGAQGLVGKVIQTAQFESMVMPLYGSRAFVSARFVDSRYEGIVEGQGAWDAPLIMRFIQKRASGEINTGDVVITSGVGRIYPTEINIGRVSNVLYHADEISMEVQLETTVDFSRLEYVFVLDNSRVQEDEGLPVSGGAYD
jgi:rod shape-determining protein MreC